MLEVKRVALSAELVELFELDWVVEEDEEGPSAETEDTEGPPTVG